jgi:hypothetical protein
MSTIKTDTTNPRSYEFAFERLSVRGLPSPELRLCVSPSDGDSFGVRFDRNLTPSETERLTRYLCEAPESKLDEIFGPGAAARTEISEADKKAEEHSAGTVVLDALKVLGIVGSAVWLPPLAVVLGGLSAMIGAEAAGPGWRNRLAGAAKEVLCLADF